MINDGWTSKTAILLQTFIPSLIIPAIILIALYYISLQNYLLFHGIVELAGIAVALCIFIIVWNTRKLITNTFFLIVGISFLFTGSFDLIHTLAYKGMGVFAGAGSDLPTQLWIAARYFQSITFLIATLFIGKTITKNRKYDTEIIIITFTFACSILYASIFVWQNFPHCFIDGSGLTPFKIISEYVISAILIATIILIYVRQKAFDHEVWQLLLAALIFMILGELAFTSYISVYGFMNMLGHLFRLISVYLFYRAFVVVSLTQPYNLLFRELKENENALRESEARFHSLFDHMEEGNALHELVYDNGDRVIEYRILAVNAAYEKVLGIRQQDAVGKLSCDLYHSTEPPYLDIYTRVEQSDKAESFEIFYPGLMKHFIISAYSPKKGQFATVFTDITERKRVDDSLHLASKKLKLLSSITRHDINNQMTALCGYTTLLERKQPDSSFVEYFQKINAAAERISAMIQFTREYENIGVETPVWQDCRTLADTAAKQASLGQVLVKNDIPAGAEVFADPLVVKVCYNLMDNAVQYGGKITTIRFSVEELNGNHVIVCKDDGDGVVAEEKEKIFERGFGRNTGLGLALTREILDITGITIRETGEPGKGARFEMAVPKGAWRMAGDGV